MSLEAFIWAARLPMDAMGLAERCVLSLLADHAHRDGRNAWRSTESIAEELHCSKRHVQRALASLRARGFIREGDQHLVDHIRHDRRPKVYDLNLMWGFEYTTPTALHGMTTDVTPHGVTDLSRGDSHGRSGVTTAGAHRTVSEPSTGTNQTSHTAGVTPLCPKSRDQRGLHQFNEQTGWCDLACGQRAPELAGAHA